MVDAIDNHSENIPSSVETENQKRTLIVDWYRPKNELGHLFRSAFDSLPQEEKTKLRKEIDALEPNYHMISRPGAVIYDLGHDGRGYEDFPQGTGRYSSPYAIPLTVENITTEGRTLHSELTVGNLASQIADQIATFIANRGKNNFAELWEGQHDSLAKQATALRLFSEVTQDYPASLTLQQENDGTYTLRDISAHPPR